MADFLFKMLPVFLTKMLLLVATCSYPFYHEFLSQAFVIKRRPEKVQLFYKQEAGRGHGEWGLFERVL